MVLSKTVMEAKVLKYDSLFKELHKKFKNFVSTDYKDWLTLFEEVKKLYLQFLVDVGPYLNSNISSSSEDYMLVEILLDMYQSVTTLKNYGKIFRNNKNTVSYFATIDIWLGKLNKYHPKAVSALD